MWTEVRHMHMKDALDKLIADFKAYAGEHGGKFGGEGWVSRRSAFWCRMFCSHLLRAHMQWNELERHEGHVGQLAAAA